MQDLQMFFIIGIVLVKGIVCEPFLGGPTTPVCKSDNENLTFTCKDSQVTLLEWKTKPDLFNYNGIIFSFNNENGEEYGGNFTAILTNKDNVNITLQIANLTSTLTVPTSRISNGTMIICETSSAENIWQSSFKLTTADRPYPTVTNAITRADVFQENYTTAIQFLETLFNDGGDPIDYYIISFNDSEATSFRWSTSGKTSTATLLPYNISVFNVTAHNCAGPSDTVTVQTYQADCPLPSFPANGSIDNYSNSVHVHGAILEYHCNEGFQPREVQNSTCEDGQWRPDPAELQCQLFMDERGTAVCQTLECLQTKGNSTKTRKHSSGTLIVAITVPVAVVTIAICLVALLILSFCKQTQSSKNPRRKPLNSASTRSIHGDNERAEIQHGNSTLTSTVYSYAQFETRHFTQQNIPDYYATVGQVHQPKPSQSPQMVGVYAEIGDLNAPLSLALPPPPTEDTVHYSTPDLTHVAPKSSLPPPPSSSNGSQPPPPPSSNGTQPPPPPSSNGSQPPTDQPLEDSDVHPLDQTINGHLILLQLVPVQAYWHSFGSAAGLEEEILDMINADLSDDSERLTEVVFRWLEQKTSSVTWADVAHLCTQTGFHELAEAITKAYETGFLPVQDNKSIEQLQAKEKRVPPALPPRRDTESEMEGSPPPPLPPPLSSEAVLELTYLAGMTQDEEEPQLPPRPPKSS